MTITPSELEERLLRADRARLSLRRATRDLMKMGEWIRERRGLNLDDQPGSVDR